MALSPEENIQEKVRKIHNLVANIRVVLTYTDEKVANKIITSVMHSTPECAAVIRNPHWKKHIEKIEKVHRAATRWVPSLRDLSYEGTL